MKDKNKDSSESAHGNKLCPACGARVPDDAPAKMCPSCLAAQIMLSQNSVTTAAFIPPSVEELQRLIPGIEVKRMLGHGGMGAVYKGLQTSLGRAVAIKLLPLELSEGDPTFEERFRREAQTMAKLDHPNIVTIYDFGETVEGQCYIIMEYIEGSNLYELIHGGDMTSAEALALIPQICNGLQYAHDHGVVHRDIKPANILINRKGKVKLTDFGLAKLLGNQPGQYELTMTGAAMGTPHYSAPEQARPDGVIDHRVDIYSLGVVLYELLTGQIPRGVFEPPSKKKIEIDVRLDEVVIRAMQADPERRYQQASEIKSQVDAVCHDTAGKAKSSGVPNTKKRNKGAGGWIKREGEFPSPSRQYKGRTKKLVAISFITILLMLVVIDFSYHNQMKVSDNDSNTVTRLVAMDNASASDLDDAATIQKILGEAKGNDEVEWRSKSGEEFSTAYVGSSKKPYTGWIADYHDGKLSDLRQIKDGKLLLWTGFYKGGQRSWERRYIRGNRVESAISWMPGGSKCPLTNVEQGMGKEVRYYENGRRKWETHIENGQRHGLTTVWYEDGQMMSEFRCIDGQRHGVHTGWDSLGRKILVDYYETGQKLVETNFGVSKFAEILCIEYYKNGQMKHEAHYYEDDKHHGPATAWYENGQKKAVERYLDDKLITVLTWLPDGSPCPLTNVKDGNGVSVSYQENGQIKSEANYKHGVRHGLEVHYDDKGKKKSEINYKHDVRHGLEVRYDDKGKKKSETNYKEGRMDGGMHIRYYSNGQKESEEHWTKEFEERITKVTTWLPDGSPCPLTTVKDGNGVSVAYYKNGQIKSEANYKHGVRHGLEVHYDDKGKKKSEINYTLGIKDGGMNNLYYSNGQKASEAHWQMGSEWRQPSSDLLPGDGLLITVSSWLPDGSLCPLTNVKDGNGVLVAYHENGQKKSETRYKEGMRDGGMYIRYYSNGQKASEAHWQMGSEWLQPSSDLLPVDGLLMTVSRWLPDGSPCPLTTVKDGNGVSVAYYENGQIKSEANYKHGVRHGLEVHYVDKGQWKTESHYKEGMPQLTIESCYDQNGQKLEETHYKHGSKHGLTTVWYSSGQKESEERWQRGADGLLPENYLVPGNRLLMTVSRWLPDGSPCPLTTMKDGNGVVVAYHENGQIKLEVNYKHGVRHGLEVHYDDKGQKRRETHCKEGKRVKKIK